MEVRIENGMLVIELPLQKPHPSSTGKTLLVASTGGVQPSTSLLKGKRISIVANAFIYPDRKPAKRPSGQNRTRKVGDGEYDE